MFALASMMTFNHGCLQRFYFESFLLLLHCFWTCVPSNFGVQTKHAKFVGITGRDNETHVALRPTPGGSMHTRGVVVADLLHDLLDDMLRLSLAVIKFFKNYKVARNK